MKETVSVSNIYYGTKTGEYDNWYTRHNTNILCSYVKFYFLPPPPPTLFAIFIPTIVTCSYKFLFKLSIWNLKKPNGLMQKSELILFQI